MSSPLTIQSNESAEERKQHPDITQELDAPPSDEEREPNITVCKTSSQSESLSVRSDYNNTNVGSLDYENFSLDRLRRTSTLVKMSSSQTLLLEAPLLAK